MRRLVLVVSLVGCGGLECEEIGSCDECAGQDECLWVDWDDGSAECVDDADKDDLPPSHAAITEDADDCD